MLTPPAMPVSPRAPLRYRLFGIGMSLTLMAGMTLASAEEDWSGRRIMEESERRHQHYPYVYEEQSMVLTDAAGHRDVRKLRRYSRFEADGTVRFLLVFDHPAEVRGVALLARRTATGEEQSSLYLPAFGGQLKTMPKQAANSTLLGSDFAMSDLTAEVLDDFQYRRREDIRIGKRGFFVVDALPGTPEVEQRTGYSRRRHFLRKDNLYIARTDYFDRHGRFLKRRTQHDLKRVEGDMWRANMILMEWQKDASQSLIKIDRRVFSHDYVPAEMFTAQWLLANRHVRATERLLYENPGEKSPETDTLP